MFFWNLKKIAIFLCIVQVSSHNLYKDVKKNYFNLILIVKFGKFGLWMIATLIISQNWKTKH
jgi:hypothetical protein